MVGLFLVGLSAEDALPGGSEILVGAGDIAACDNTGDEATADLLDEIPGTVFTAGDNVYESGTKGEFYSCYNPTWGRHKDRTQPTPGNHDYGGEGYEDKADDASAYFDYFGDAAGGADKVYYSYDLGEWHIVALSSTCDKVGGCDEESPQIQWLKEDLAISSKECILAYWHHPLFSSGYHGGDTRMKPAWEVLYEAGVAVIVNGHDHTYERFAPQDPEGNVDPEHGIREFVVGTGGKSLYPWGSSEPNSEFGSADAYGVIKFTLRPGSYDWEFVLVKNMRPEDSGSGSCRGQGA